MRAKIWGPCSLLSKGKWIYIPKQGSRGFIGSIGNHDAGGPPMATFVDRVNRDIKNGKIISS